MLLLDTSVLLWILTDSPRLGGRARRLVETATAVHVSSVTVAELTIKSMLGKITIPDGLPGLIVESGLRPLDVTAEHAAAILDFPELTRHDPFDRLLVAQAAIAKLRLLTADRVILGLGRDFILDAAE